MSKDKNWPEYCTLIGCADYTLRPHHHHMARGHLSTFACTCGQIDQPGTRPREKK